MDKYLFIGGPRDGDLVPVEPRNYIEVVELPPTPINPVLSLLDVPPPSFNVTTYERHSIIYREFSYSDSNEVYVYVKRGLNFGVG